MTKLDTMTVRRQFPMYERTAEQPFVYLDSAASAQTPLPVLQAMDDYYRKFRANVHRGMYPASQEATERFEAARCRLATFIKAEPDEVIFTRGCTESLNLLAYSLAPQLQPDDEVVLTVLEHHSNLVPWQQLSKRYGFKVKHIGLTEDQTLDLEQARQLIGPRTKVVAFVHVSNALGAVSPAEELVRLARQHGATVIIDAAQSVGHRPVDVKALDCDFLACSAHKIYGPTGVGALFGRRERLDALPPFLYGGDMILEVSLEDSRWNELPWKFEAGTPNIAGAIGFGAAVEFIESVGVDSIAAHESELVKHAMGELARVPGLRIFGPPAGQDRGGVISFALGDIHAHDMTDILAREGVCVRGGHHCAMPLMRLLGVPGTTRASLSIYNDLADIEALVAAVRKAAQLFKL